MLVRALLLTTLLGAANELDAEQCDRAEEEAELLDVQLLQTSFQITPKAKAERAVKAVAPEQHWTGGAAMPEDQSLLQTSFEVSLSSTVFTGGIVGNEGWRLQPNASCFVDGLWPVSGTAPLLVQLGTVHELGNLGRSEPARTSTAFYFMDMLSSRSSLVLTVYFCIYLFSIVSIHYNMTTRVKDKAAPGKVPQDRKVCAMFRRRLKRFQSQESCLEDEIYKRNPLSWLCVPAPERSIPDRSIPEKAEEPPSRRF
ncbi:unnamed protein product [Effrenium voratum]|nr:unnamed protein product [Effrenium voratum]